MDLEDVKKKFGVEAHHVEELEDFIKIKQPGKVYINTGINSDSGLSTLVPEEKYWGSFTVDTEVLHEILSDCRVYKSNGEIEALKWASQISCEAHCYVLQHVKPGMREKEIEALFKYFCESRYHCDRAQPYTPICGCGQNAATLHYPDNDAFLEAG